MDIESSLKLIGETWSFAAAEPGPYEWFDPSNPGAPGNYLKRGKNETPLDGVRLVVLNNNGTASLINANMVRELDGDGNPTGKWVLRPGDPGHATIGNGQVVVASADGYRGQVAVAVVEFADQFVT